MRSKKVLAERKRLYDLGVQHRRFGLSQYHQHHKYLCDYLDGFHGRPFRDKYGRPNILARFFLHMAKLAGA